MEGKELVALSGAIIAAILAIAKLIADKESRTSDFRKDWIGSFRSALAELLGEAYVISGRIWIRVQHAQVDAERSGKSVGAPLLGKADTEVLEEQLTSHWNTLRKAHRTVLLHLNFGETAWGLPYITQDISVEQKVEERWKLLIRNSQFSPAQQPSDIHQTSQNGSPSGAAALLVSELERLIGAMLGPYEKVGTKEQYALIKRSIDDATLLGNLVIKPEWNRIKKGERNYRSAMGFLKCFGAIGVIILLIVSVGESKPTAPAGGSTINVSVSGAPQAIRSSLSPTTSSPTSGLMESSLEGGPSPPSSHGSSSQKPSWPPQQGASRWSYPERWLPPSEPTSTRP